MAFTPPTAPATPSIAYFGHGSPGGPPNENQRWSGDYHVIGTETRKSLESWLTQRQAEYFCDVANAHNETHGHAERFTVEHRPDSRRG